MSMSNKLAVIGTSLVMMAMAHADRLGNTISEINGYATVFAAAGLFIMACYSGYKYMFAQEILDKKEAQETLTYALMGTVLVLMAEPLAKALGGA